jgi:hypothetical protein
VLRGDAIGHVYIMSSCFHAHTIIIEGITSMITN